MEEPITLDTICVPSADVVAREIEGNLVIVPLAAGIGNADDELYTLNETGRVIWRELDGQKTLKSVAAALAGEFDSTAGELEKDVLGFASELTHLGILCRGN